MNTRQRISQFFAFCLWGGITTVINIAVYALCRFIAIPVVVSTALAWIICVGFAFISNRKYVFHSKSSKASEIIRESISFYASRLLSGLLDMGLMLLTVDIFKFNEFYCKVGTEIVISALNYIMSIFIIFTEHRKNKKRS